MSIKRFTEYSRVVLPEQQEGDPSLCNELSGDTIKSYVKKAKKSVSDMEKKDDTAMDDKHFKRKMYISFAQNFKLHEGVELSEDDGEFTVRHPEEKKAYVTHTKTGFKSSNKHGKVKHWNEHGKRSAYKHADIKEVRTFAEFLMLAERELLSPSYYATVHRRDTKKPGVLHRRNRKMKGMYRKNTTQYVTKVLYKQRSAHDPGHLTTRSKHQLTDRWRDQRLVRIRLLRKNKNMHEDYSENRELLHNTHAEVGRELARKQRDPELKRLLYHRADKHAHAAGVLSRLREIAPKKK